MASLHVIGTPIGNLEDITLRALRVLKEADTVVCEDTRVTRTLFSKYGINTPTLSYHAQSALSKTDMILDMLAEGKKLALVSDAGTPGISDPGSMLVSKVRERFAAEIASGEMKIEAIPGPSALTAALSIAGVPCADFLFLGFLPHKKGRETLFKEIAASVSASRTVVFYESPHRIMKALESLIKTFSETSAKVTVCRELTKIYEEVVSGTPEEVFTFLKNNEEKIRGEFVVIVSVVS